VRALYQVITRAADVRRGTAVFAGTRIPVKTFVDHLDRGGSVEEFVQRNPQISKDQLLAACALGLEILTATVPLEPVIEQGSLLPRLDPSGAIVNALELGAPQVVGKRVLCPACRTLVFRSWPEGWDGHAARRCRGLKAKDSGPRKAEFKRRFEHLFR
jgi:uncharacterized protein (DUF433 family)